AQIDIDDIDALAQAGNDVRRWIAEAPLPPSLAAVIGTAYAELERQNPDATFAVRSSATAEDTAEASFAGQQETFLNIKGLDSVVHAIKEVFVSLYNDRAIAYRAHHGY